MKLKIQYEFTFFYDVLMRYISFFGSLVFWCFAVILLVIIGQHNFALVFASASIATMIIEYLVKFIHHKRRPDFNKINTKSLFARFQEIGSFPSGHSANIALFTTLIAFNYRIFALTLLFTIITVLVGMSRIYLRRHYVHDVIGGIFLGVLTGICFGIFLL